MRRAGARAGCALLLFLAAACEQMAGLNQRTFVDLGAVPEGAAGEPAAAGSAASNAGGSSGGRTSAGGASGTFGESGQGPAAAAGTPSAGMSGGGASAGSAAAGGAGGAAAGGGGAGGAPSAHCEAVTAQLCMRPPWPAGVIPFAGSSAWDDETWDLVRWGVSVWDNMPIGSAELHFVEESRPGVPTLVFSLEEGCEPIAVTDEAVTLAFASCRESLDVARAIGVALGLPRMHQRVDRNRYLQMAPRSAFDCRRGEHYEICPAMGDIPALLGPFEFDTTMFTPAVCQLGDDGYDYLYLPRGDFHSVTAQCNWVTQVSSRTERETSAIAELYAMQHGWRPALPLGEQAGELSPPRLDIGEQARHTGTLAVVELGDLDTFPPLPKAVLFALASSGAVGEEQYSVWMLPTSNGDDWGGPEAYWEKLASPSPSPPFAGELTALRRGQTTRVDLFTGVDRLELHHASIDLATRQTTGWTDLGRPSSVPLVIASTPDGPVAYATDYSAVPSGFQTYVLDVFDAPPSWNLVPELTVTEPMLQLAVQPGHTTQHFVARFGSELRYKSHSPEGDWSDWSTIVRLAEEILPMVHVSLVSTAHHELGIVVSSGGYLAFHACNQAPCNDPSAWSEPVRLDGEQLTPVGQRPSAILTTNDHELALLVPDASYLWFAACEQGPCDSAEAWDVPIALTRNYGAGPAFTSGDRIDAFLFHYEDRIDAPREKSLWVKSWRAPAQ